MVLNGLHNFCRETTARLPRCNNHSNRTPATSTTSSTTTTQQQQQQQQQQEMKEKTKRQTGTESKDHYQLVWRESRIKKTNIKFNFFMMGRCTIRAPA
jgi:hypothetical protein